MMDAWRMNWDALTQHRPQLAARIEAIRVDENRYRLTPTQTLFPTLEIHDSSGAHLLYSRYDPMKETSRDLDRLPDGEIFTPLLLGVGLGYALRLLYDRRREQFFDAILVERDPAVLRLALQTTPLHDAIADPRFHIHLGDDFDAWRETARAVMPAVMSTKLQPVAHPPSQRRDPAYYQRIIDLLSQRMVQTRAEFDLMVKSGPLIQENLWHNLPAILRSSGVARCGACLAGRPAIVVAAGPSLDKNAAQLAAARERCAVIAVDTALRTLQAHGVQPHIVVSNDPTALNQKHFEGVELSPEMILAYDPELYSAIALSWPGPRLLMNLEKAVFTRWIERAFGPFGYSPKGVSVGNAAFHLARALGANPIIFAGLDLAFDPKGGKTHASASALHRDHGAISPGGREAELGPRWGADAMRESIVWVDGIAGGKVPTSEIMSIYIQQFADEIARTRARVIDATEGGARVPGTQVMTLQDALSHCGDGFDASIVLSGIRPAPRDAARDAVTIERVLHEMAPALDEARRGAELSRALEEKPSSGGEIRDTEEWKRMERCFSAIHGSEAVKIAMEQAMFEGMLQFIQKEPWNQAGVRLQKYRAYFDMLIERAPRFLALIEEVKQSI